MGEDEEIELLIADTVAEINEDDKRISEMIMKHEAQVRTQIYLNLLMAFRVSGNTDNGKATIRLLKQHVLGHNNIIGEDGL